MLFGLPAEYYLAQELARMIDRDRDTRDETQHKTKSMQQTAAVTDKRRQQQPEPCLLPTPPGCTPVTNV